MAIALRGNEDKSIGVALYLIVMTPMDTVIEQWQIPQHQWAVLKLLRGQLLRQKKYKKSTAAMAGTTLGDALIDGGVTQEEILKIWVPMVQNHCEKTKLLDPLNKG